MKRVRNSIGKDEFKRLITYTLGDPNLKEHSRNKMLRILAVLYYTGMRVNEVALIRVEQLRELIANREGVVFTPKKSKERKIFLSEEAAKELKKLINDEEENRAYIASSWNKKFTAMHPISLIQFINKYMKQVLGNGYTSHSFRQGIITDMFAAHVSTATVQQFIGHSDPSTTLRYAKPTDEHIRSSLVR